MPVASAYKRKAETSFNDSPPKKKSNIAWDKEYQHYLKNPDSALESTEYFVTIKCKFPKSKHHYILISKIELDSVWSLDDSPEHVALLTEMLNRAKLLPSELNLERNDFMVGFHAKSSLKPLHLHIISKDFLSPHLTVLSCLK
jgi:aprataxin